MADQHEIFVCKSAKPKPSTTAASFYLLVGLFPNSADEKKNNALKVYVTLHAVKCVPVTIYRIIRRNPFW